MKLARSRVFRTRGHVKEVRQEQDSLGKWLRQHHLLLIRHEPRVPERLAAIRSRRRLVQARVITANHKEPYTSRTPVKSRSGDLKASLTVPITAGNEEIWGVERESTGVRTSERSAPR